MQNLLLAIGVTAFDIGDLFSDLQLSIDDVGYYIDYKYGDRTLVPDAFDEGGPFPHPADPIGGEGDDLFDDAISTPIALDLDGDGLEYVSRANSDVFFDVDNDQFAEHVEWLKGDDGFLVRDTNSNGQIDNVGEMFGGNGGTTAWAKLDALDTDNPGGNALNSSDTAWSTLRVWKDANEDGTVDSGELKTMAELGITSISTAGNADTVLGGHAIAGQSIFTMNGQSRTSADVLFDTDQLNSWFVGDGTAGSTEIDLDTLFLPLSRGYGTMPSLHYAMTQDATLKGMVEDFATIDLASVTSSMYDQLDEIVIRWAGAQGVSATGRGSFVDGQHLAVLEDVQGQPYYSAAYGGSNPSSNLPAGRLGEAYALFAEQILERLMVQGPLQSVFPNATYSFSEDRLELGDTLSAVITRALAGQPTPGGAAHKIYWNEISRITEHYATDLGTTVTAGKAAIDNAAGFVTLPITVAGTAGNDYLASFDNNDVIRGGAGNDTMMGSGGEDIFLFGSDSGSDVIADANGSQGYDGIRFETLNSSQIALSKSGAGNHDLTITASGISETIIAQNHYGVNVVGGREIGDSIREIQFADGVIWDLATIDNIVENGASAPTPLVGTTGANTLTATSTTLNMTGLAGGDTFVIAQNSNKFVTITDFKPGEDKVDITAFTGISNYSLHLGPQDLLGHATVTIGTTTGNLQLNFSGLGTGQLSASDFRSNTLYDGYGQTLVGGASNDSIQGTVANDTIYGNEGSDTLRGDAGHDAIYGWTGNDTIYAGDGNDIATGDDGNDYLEGYYGADSLYGGVGADTMNGQMDDDVLGGDDGNDSLLGDSGNDTLAGGVGADTINGGNGLDTASYAGSSAGVTIYMDGWGGAASYSGGDATGDTATGIENLSGSAQDDIFVGSTGANVLTGLDGNDILAGIGGADTLDGGNGFDGVSFLTYGSAVSINLATNSHGGAASGVSITSCEEVYGSAYNDTIVGSAADERLRGNGGIDSLTGGDGNDTLLGGAGADTLTGGNGGDWADYTGSTAGVDVRLLSASQLYGDAAGDVLSSIEHLKGSALADTLLGDSANNQLLGEAGDDALNGMGGADSMDGGDGFDLVSYATSASAVTINLATGVHSGGDAQGDQLTSIEWIFGSTHNDSMVGGSNADRFEGYNGNDTLAGAAGADNLFGDEGNDTLAGGAGADTLTGGNGSDWADYTGSTAGVDVRLLSASQLYGDAAGDVLSGIEHLKGSALADTLLGDSGNNQLLGEAGDDALNGMGGADSMDGGGGFDLVSYATSASAVTINLATGVHSGGDAQGDQLTSIEWIFGSLYNDSITGGGNADLLYGYNGNDTLAGGAGADTLNGGAGDDTFRFQTAHGMDVIQDFTGAGAAGGDVIHLSGLGYSTFAGLQSNISYNFGTSTATITTSAGNVITVNGVTTNFVSGDFSFA